MLVDSHCHLTFPGLAEDVEAVLERARTAGIGTVVTICTRLDEFADVLALAERFADVYCSVGVHPHEASRETDVVPARLVELALHPRVVGIGETGLDFYYENSAREDQIERFRAHIGAAQATGLPLIVHSRDADEETAEILADATARGPLRGVIHCFTGSKALANAALEMGFYLSFSGIVTFKNADDLREIAADVPADRLLVETDSPYLAPVPMRGKPNEPAFTAYTAAALAKLRGVGVDQLARRTTANFFGLFDKARAPESSEAAP